MKIVVGLPCKCNIEFDRDLTSNLSTVQSISSEIANLLVSHDELEIYINCPPLHHYGQYIRNNNVLRLYPCVGDDLINQDLADKFDLEVGKENLICRSINSLSYISGLASMFGAKIYINNEHEIKDGLSLHPFSGQLSLNSLEYGDWNEE